jgi:hypothetical protein
MICYAGTNYYYKLNLQGDVIGLINTSGTEVVSYTYDAWGAEPAPQAGRLSCGQPGRRSVSR